MLVDANILLYAVDGSSPFHERAASWLDRQLNGPTRIGLPWPSLVAFLRISTHPRAVAAPLLPRVARTFVDDWLAAPAAWVPSPGHRHGEILLGLIETYDVGGNLVSDAHLAALALEHGLAMASADSDFARFTELTWINPLA